MNDSGKNTTLFNQPYKNTYRFNEKLYPTLFITPPTHLIPLLIWLLVLKMIRFCIYFIKKKNIDLLCNLSILQVEKELGGGKRFLDLKKTEVSVQDYFKSNNFVPGE